MTYFSGVNGVLEIDNKKAGRVSGWQLSPSQGLVDVTSLGDTDKVSTVGIRTTTGSCTVFYYQETPGSNSANECSLLLNKIIKARLSDGEPGQAEQVSPVTFKLKIDDGTANGKYVKVEALITSANLGATVGDIMSSTVSFEAIGAPQEVTI